MLPDLRTLILATSILCAVQALGMLVLWSLNRRLKGIGLWAAGMATQCFQCRHDRAAAAAGAG